MSEHATTGPAWTMTYSGPQTMLATAYGDVEVTFTDAGHAHVSAYSDGNRAGDVVYRGKHWYLSVHVYAEHGWDERPLWIETDGRREYTGEYRHQFSEQDPVRYSTKTIAPTYRAAIMTAITGAVSAYVKANPRVLGEADVNNLQHELERARTAENDCRTAYLAAHEHAANLAGDLRRARERLDTGAYEV